jgi:hypothetical protein
MIMESIGFMDALDASKTVKKDLKKRKRLPSGSSGSSKKDEIESPKIDQKPLKFYKDTLEEADEEMTNGETSPTKDLDTSALIEEAMERQENGEKNSIASPAKDEVKVPVEEEKEPEIVVRPPGLGCGPDGKF